MSQAAPPPVVWVLVDRGDADGDGQCIALAQMLGASPVVWRIFLPWFLPRFLLKYGLSLWFLRAVDGRLRLRPPYPTVLLAKGALSTLVAARLKKLCKEIFTVALGRPSVPAALFDLTIAPLYEAVEGGQTLKTLGTLHSLTDSRLLDLAHRFFGQLHTLPPQPWVMAVFMGSTKRGFPWDRWRAFVCALKKLHRETGCGFLFVFQGEKEIKKRVLQDLRECPYILSLEEGLNVPWEAFLGMADYVLADGGAFPFCSRILVAGKPLFIHGASSANPRLDAFYQELFHKGLARPFEGKLFFWSLASFNEMERVKNEVEQALAHFLNAL